MAEGFRHDAGGSGESLKVCRFGRGEFTQKEGVNVSGGELLPGHAVQLTATANGDAGFDYHDGAASTPIYVVVEARGRGMSADTDEGYADGEGLTAVRASGGGLNVKLSSGETVALGDEIGVDSASVDGTFTSTVADYNFVYGEVDEALDLSGASSAELVATEVAN